MFEKEVDGEKCGVVVRGHSLEAHGVRREVGYRFVMMALALVTVGGLIESIAMSSR